LDLVPSDIRLITIALVVVVLVAVVAWEYARRRAANPHKKIDSE
jgi:heme/copper-type cytochrome/quinol oxidase subunit 2